jgi:hypothetical protein
MGRPTAKQRIEASVNVELAKFTRAAGNIAAACDDGRISEHDRDERIARLEQSTANRIAFIRGEKRPPQREPEPLDDPDAGKVR